MHVETLIYAYLAICTSMIFFNCACIFVFRRRDTALQNRSSRLVASILSQLERIRAGESVEERHKDFLKKKLARTANLMAFDEALEQLLDQDPETLKRYLQELGQVFTYLAIENRYRNSIKITYFSYVIHKYRIVEGKPVHVILDLMMKLLQEPSLYCRENALQVIYSAGDCGWVLRALKEVDQSERFHHPKLLTDGLLTFGGDSAQLADALWREFDQFSVRMRTVILDYFRFSGQDMPEELLQLMADIRQDDELRFSCIRYFGKYRYEPAYPLLVSFAEDADGRRWEYAAIAVMALAAYPGERSIEVLKHALSSSNWYIRFNASKSLETFHLTYWELSDVFDSNDRYAREILQYRMDLQNAREMAGKNQVKRKEKEEALV